VRTFSMLVNVPGALIAPTTTMSSSATTRPRFRPAEPERKRRHAGCGVVVTVVVVVVSGGVRTPVGEVCSLTRRILS